MVEEDVNQFAGSETAGCTRDGSPEEEGMLQLEEEKIPEAMTRKTRKLQMVWLSLNVTACGMCVGLRGPTLLDLQRVTNSSFTHISVAVFTSMAAGWTIGGISGGAILDRLKKNNMVMGLFGIGSGLFTFMLAWTCNIAVLACTIAISGAFISAYEAGAFTLCFELLGNSASPFSQLLVMVFSLGNFISPLLVEGFHKLSPFFQANSTEIEDAISQTNNSEFENITMHMNSTNILDIYDSTTSSVSKCGDMASFVEYNHFYWLSYITVGIITLLTSCPFFINACLNTKTNKHSENDNELAENQPHTRYFVIKILSLLMIFSFFYSGVEEILGGFLKVFALKQYCWSESNGNMLVSLYWGTFTFSKLIGIIESLYLHPGIIVILHFCMLIVSFISLLLVDIWQTWLWILCVIIGIAVSPIWPARLAWTDRYIKLSGKLVGLIFVMEGAGSMIWPSLMGFLMETFGLKCFVYVLCILGFSALFIFIVMHCIAKQHGERSSTG